MSITHTKVSAVPDGVDTSLVLPSDWNADHTVTSPLTVATIIGGTLATSSLTLKPTSGVGTTGADIIFQVGNNGGTEAMRIANSGHVSVATGPIPEYLFALRPGASAFGLVTNDFDSGANTGSAMEFAQDSSSGNTVAGRINVYGSGFSASGTLGLQTDSGGGVTIGSPTGGDKGAGTLNTAGDIYKNNTAYTSPDYVLEHWATGRIERFADHEGAAEYPGLRPLAEVKAFLRTEYTLPEIAAARTRGQGSVGVFAGGDAVLAALEAAYLYIFELEARVRTLETRGGDTPNP